MDIDGKQVEAELLPAEKARAIYEEIVRKSRDPALLEYAGRAMFKVRIFPIEPNSKKRIQLKYTELLKQDNGLLDYHYTLNTEKFSSKPLKNVSMNEQYFLGHFPSHPIMPGVLQLEAIAQVAGILMLRQIENQGRVAYFMSAESVKWRNPVRPGDTLMIDVELTKTRGKIGKAKGVCSVNGTVVSEAEVTFMLVES
jgi:3-hydroxymyristoyl/3-hydroxydecanoyl-(acyl carrier protein) dehydratase